MLNINKDHKMHSRVLQILIGTGITVKTFNHAVRIHILRKMMKYVNCTKEFTCAWLTFKLRPNFTLYKIE